MDILWYALVGALFGAYFVLAGFDYGTGLLARHIGRTDGERRAVLGAVGPFFLGNEVWLVGAIGALLGAFPLLDGELLGGNSTLFAGLLFGLVVFTACVQLRSRAVRGRAVFDVLISLGALVTAAGWGAVLGQMLQGRGGAPNWYSLLCGLAFALLVVQHGAVFLALRLGRAKVRAAGDGELPGRARAIVRSGVVPTLAAVLATAVAGFFAADAVQQPAVALALVVVLAAAVLGTGRFTRAGRPGLAVASGSVAMLTPLLIVGLSRLPYAHVDAADPAASLTVAQAAADPATLDLLIVAAAPLIPVLLGFQAASWWMWRRNADAPLFF